MNPNEGETVSDNFWQPLSIDEMDEVLAPRPKVAKKKRHRDKDTRTAKHAPRSDKDRSTETLKTDLIPW